MFRFTFISIITLRVIFCPLLCIGCDDGMQAFHTSETHVCNCSDTKSEPCQSSETPTPFDSPSGCPCDTGCIFQVTLESNNRTVGIGFFLMVDFLPICFDTQNLLQESGSHCEEMSQRLDLESGHDVRIAHASFLL